MPDLVALPNSVRTLLDDFFSSPIKIDRDGNQHDIRCSSLRKVEAEVLAQLVCTYRSDVSLEIGLAEGGSCVAITASRQFLQQNAKHIVLDPFQETLTGSAGLLELSRLGLREAMSWIPERSESYLSQRWRTEDVPLDFAFVDGGHDIGQKVTDAFLLDKVLRPGGIVAFHDAVLISTSMAVRHLVRERFYSIISLPSDRPFAMQLRRFRYARTLGLWYSRKVIPRLCRSLVALRKPATSGQPSTAIL